MIDVLDLEMVSPLRRPVRFELAYYCVADFMRSKIRSLTSRCVKLLATVLAFGALATPPAVAQDNQQNILNPSMALNLNGISDWTSQHPFINAAKYARPWLGHLEGRWGGISNEQLRATGHVNERGWPVAMPDNSRKLSSLVFTDQPADLQSVRGRYRLTYEGDVDIGMSGSARIISQKPGEIWFEYRADGVQPVSVDLTRINPDAPLTKLEIVHEDNIAAFEVGALFNPNWLKLVKDFRVLRMMGWMSTNNSTVETWAQMPTTADYTYSDGVPVEVMVDLANLIGIDPWFTLPHMSDDDLVRNFAQVVKTKLDPSRRAYVEYSNEVWNFQFDQTRWADAQAKELWGGRAGGDAWIQYAGLRAAQIAQIFDDVFGDEADARLVNVISVHTAWTDLAEAQLSGPLLRRMSDHDPSQVFDAYAVTGYLRPDFEDGETGDILRGWLEEGGRDYAFEQIDKSIRETRLKNLKDVYWPEHAARAQSYGLDLIMYEGGTHVILPYNEPVDEDLIALLNDFNYSPQMAQLYDEAIEIWYESGGLLFNAFVDVAIPSRYGSWGLLRHIDDSTARWDIISQRNLVPSKYEPDRDPRDFQSGVFMASTESEVIEGTPRNDVLIGTDGDDILLPSGGYDRLNGGDGFDQMHLSGLLDDYNFRADQGRFLATSQDQTVYFTGVEYIVFPSEGLALFPEDLIP